MGCGKHHGQPMAPAAQVPGQGQGDLAATVDPWSPPTLKNNSNILLFALFDTRMLLQ